MKPFSTENKPGATVASSYWTDSLCGQVMLSRYVDLDLAGGRAQLRQVRQLYCPDGHESRLAPEARRLADAVEAVLRLTLIPVGAGQRAQVAA